VGWLGSLDSGFRPPRVQNRVRPSREKKPLQWVPVLGYPNGTASYIPDMVLSFEGLVHAETHSEDTSDPIVDLSIDLSIDLFIDETNDDEGDFTHNVVSAANELKAGTTKAQTNDLPNTEDPIDSSDKEILWRMFAMFIRNDGPVRTTDQLATIYSVVLWHPFRIMGMHADRFDRNSLMTVVCKPWDRVSSSWVYVATREIRAADRHESRPYCLAFIKQSREDQPEGWARAEEEAKMRATETFLQGEYRLWMAKWEHR
jgi:hypothetical protein